MSLGKALEATPSGLMHEWVRGEQMVRAGSGGQLWFALALVAAFSQSGDLM